MLKHRIIQIALSLLAFAVVLALGNSSLANEKGNGHGAPQGEHAAAGGAHKAPLFPQPTADLGKSSQLGTPELLEPTYMAKVTGGAATLKWKAVETADYYTVQLATDPNFKWLVANEVMHKTTSYDAKGLMAGKHYYWRIFAGKSDNEPGYTKSFAAKSMFETAE